MNFTSVILAGGSGERFWPFSTPEKPKQFLDIFSQKSLLKETYQRLKPITKNERFFVVTTSSLVSLTRKELPDMPRANIIGEPFRRDTCAAVALGLSKSNCKDDEIIGFFPADHVISKAASFRTALISAAKLAQKEEAIVTLGIKPHSVSDQYGYINPVNGEFIEKPSLAKAKKLIAKKCLWNAGIFIGRAGVFRAAFEKFAPSFLFPNLRGAKLLSTYEALERMQFDRAIMEKLSSIGAVRVIQADIGWDDVGSYAALERHFKADKNGNVVIGQAKVDSSNGVTVISRGSKVAVLGLKNVIVAVNGDKILVVDKSKTSNIKRVVS